MAQLNGRVFTRLQQYDAMPTELKREVEELEQYLTSNQAQIFDTHRTLKLKTVYGVRMHTLLEKIDAWVNQHGHGAGHGVGHGHGHGVGHTQGHEVGHGVGHTHTAGTHGYTKDPALSTTERIKEHVPGTTAHAQTHPTNVTTQPHGYTKDPAVSKTERIKEHVPGTTAHAQTHPTNVNTQPHHGVSSTMTPVANTGTGHPVAGSAAPATEPASTHTPGHPVSLHTKTLLNALVLKGFVTPHKEDKLKDASSATDLDFKANELLVARGRGIAPAADAGPSVWDLVDSAVFAGMVKRKAGVVEAIAHGKEVYAVVNSRLRVFALFKSDLSRKPIIQFKTHALQVSFDRAHYENGVKVWNETDSELLNAASQQESDALVQALVSSGASHRDGVTPPVTTGEKVRHEVQKHVGGDATHQTAHHGHAAPMSSQHGHNLTGQHHTQPTHPMPTQGQQAYGVGSQGVAGQHGGALHGNQPSNTQYQAHGLPTTNDNLKREHGEQRGYAHTNEPTMMP